MTNEEFGLVFKTKVIPEVDSVKKFVTDLKQSLESVEMPKASTKSFEKKLKDLTEELGNFEALAGRGISKLADTKEVNASWKKVEKLFASIGVDLGDLDLSKVFPKDVTTNIEKANEALKAYQKKLEEIRSTQNYKTKAEAKTSAQKKEKTATTNWEKEVQQLEKKRTDAEADRAKWEQKHSVIYAEEKKKLEDINQQIEEQNKKLKEQEAIQERLQSEKVLTQKGTIHKNYREAVTRAAEKVAYLESGPQRRKDAQEEQRQAQIAYNLARGKAAIAKRKYGDSDSRTTNAIKQAIKAEQELQQAKQKTKQITAEVQKGETELASARKELEALNQQSELAKGNVKEIKAIKEQTQTLREAQDAAEKAIKEQEAYKIALDKSEAAVSDQEKTVEAYKNSMEKAKQATAAANLQLEMLELSGTGQEWGELTKIIKEFTDVEISSFSRDAAQVVKILEDYKVGKIKDIPELFKKIKAAAEEVEKPIKNVNNAWDELFDSISNNERVKADIENLKDSLLDFFSITNTVQIFKDAIRDAFDTVKELDAVMTETAVVTEFSIGDMWDKLPDYAAEANRLGTSIKSLYEATTLYYQQGLRSNEAMEVGVETMKMARIANMDAAQATEAMTAALRGFNMEINETSAARISDVYSELAAITAADTEQIATAMSKTASIAASANMEFETTAALLAQIIETTQEAPETAGTAMKTIIARFTEVKQLFSEGMLTGEDEEGEEININKIDEALKTVGISLKDFLNGAKGIDDIFLELASKWDELDLATQRYIATAAAGSRQQSRFIAMMSNYDRTVELVSAANNSAGASQEQFDKTLESLDAKLQRLQNAWQEFTMGLANSEVIKAAVDLLASLLEIVNKITGAAGNEGIGGLITMVVRLTTVIAALRGGSTLLRASLKGLSSILGNPKMFSGLVDALDPSIKGIGKFAKGAKEAAKVANGASKASAGLGSSLAKLGVYAIVIAAIVWAVIELAEAFKKAQNSAKLEELQNQLNETNEKAEALKQTISEIGEDRSNLKSLQKDLQNLTKGSEEWRAKLISVNQEVLNLVDKYGELSEHIVIGSSGQLTITEDGWNELIESQQTTAENLIVQQLGLQHQIAEQTKLVNYDTFMGQAYNIDEGWTRTMVQTANEVSLSVASFLDEKYSFLGMEFTGEDISTSLARLVHPFAQLGVTQLGIFHEFASEDSEDSYRDIVERSLSGGLTAEQFNQFAVALAKERITVGDDGLSKTEKGQAEAILDELGIADSEIIKGVIANAEALGLEFDKLGQQTLELENKQQAVIRSLVGNAVSTNPTVGQTSLVDAISNLVDGNNLYSQDWDTLVDQKVEDIEASKDYTDSKIKEQYAALKGYYMTGDKIYKDADYTQEVEISLDDMKEAIAVNLINSDISRQAEAQYGKFTGSEANLDLIETLFSADGGLITQEQINEYKGDEGNIDLEKIIKDLLGEDGSIEEFVDVFGVNAGHLLLDNFNKAADRITKSRINLTKKMMAFDKESYGDDNDMAEQAGAAAAQLRSLENMYGSEILDISEATIDAVGRSKDWALQQAGYDEFMRIANQEETKIEDLRGISELVSEIDWNNPIEASKRLNKEIQNGTDATKEYAQALIGAGEQVIGSGAQVRFMLQDESFSELNTEIDELVEKQGKLSAMDVEDLAKSYKGLRDVMDNTGLSASGLAKVLEEVSSGDLGLHQLTDTVLAALEGFESLEEQIDKVLKRLEEKDWGSNENDVNKFMSDTWEDVIVPNVEAGNFNNTQLNEWMDFVAGKGWDKDKTGQERKDLIVSYAQAWQKYTEAENFKPLWENLSNRKNFLGQEGTLEADYGDLRITQNEDGTFSFTGLDNQDWDTIVSFIADLGDTTSEFAEMALLDWKQKNTDGSMAEYFDKLAFDEAMNGVIEQINTAIFPYPNGDTVSMAIIDQSEIKALEALFPKYAEEINQTLIDNRVLKTDFYNDDGSLKTAGEVANNLEETLDEDHRGDQFQEWFSYNFSDGILDWNTFLSTLAELNVPEIIRTAVAEELLRSHANDVDKGKVSLTLSDGSQATVDLTANFDASAAIAQAEKDIENSNLTQAITDAITIAFYGDNSEVNVEFNFDNETKKNLDDYIEELGKKHITIPINFEWYSDPSKLPKAKSETEPTGKSRTFGGSQFSQEVIQLRATGIKHSPNSHDALVSEEGPELIQTKNGAYLTGQNGPEIAHINKGDTVYTAEETKRILSNKKHSFVPRFSEGTTRGISSITADYGGGVKLTSGSSGGSTSDLEDVWENSFDKLYNLVREIDEELHQRERIERRYEKLLEGINANAGKIIELSREELGQLEKERLLQEQLITGRSYQIEQYQNENSDLAKYADVIQNERGEDVLRIDWDAINAVTDEEEGARIEKYVSQLEEWFDALEEAEEALWDIEDSIEEIKNRGKEEYLNLENTIKEAVVQTYQQQIDKLDEINTSINDTNSSLIDAIQTSIDKQRQERDNQRAEEELAKKQRRLLYLQQDTSGANDLEILQLQDEIREGTEDYTDTLIDQKISELQEQNDKAAEQREQQITLLQAQLDHYINSGEIWNEVYALMESGLDENNGLIRGSQLEKILQDSANFSGLSAIGQQEWWIEMNNMIASALAYLEVGRQLEDIGVEEGSQIEFVTEDGQVLSGIVDDKGNVTTFDGQVYDNVYQGSNGKYYAKKNTQTEKTEDPNDEITSPPKPINDKYTEDNIIGIAESIWIKGSEASGWGSGQTRIERINSKIGNGAGNEVQDRINKISSKKVGTGQAKKNLTEYYYGKFKHGGLADFTGPAWLDGTKARPEIVLDAQDSRNFIQLRDILSSILSHGNINTSTENNGDITYDIDINVESIGSDYDVERVANKVKSLINQDARYRNNNAVSLMR